MEKKESVIRTNRLAKSFGPVRAVKGINLLVKPGEIYGFLGRNGAGKTTTIRMLLGLIRPTCGEIEIFGVRLTGASGAVKRRILSRIGSFVEGPSAYPNLTIRENLEIQRALTRAPKSSIDGTIERLNLGEYASRRAGRLSLGNKQRLSLARAMIHAPELLVLDEPANGLDPAGILEVRSLLRSLAQDKGVTIFMSSHILAEVAQLADRIGIIHNGLLIEELDTADLGAKNRGSIEVETNDPARAKEILAAGLGLKEFETGPDGGLRINDAGARTAEIARALVNSGLELKRLAGVVENLEAHFMRLTGGPS